MKRIHAFSKSISTGSKIARGISRYATNEKSIRNKILIRKIQAYFGCDLKEAKALLKLADQHPEKLSVSQAEKLISIMPKSDRERIQRVQDQRTLKKEGGKKTARLKIGGVFELTHDQIKMLQKAGYSSSQIKEITNLAGTPRRGKYMRFVNPNDFMKGSDEWKVVSALGFVDIDESGNMHPAFLPIRFSESNVVPKGNYYQKDRGWY